MTNVGYVYVFLIAVAVAAISSLLTYGITYGDKPFQDVWNAHMAGKTATEISQVLQNSGIEPKFDPATWCAVDCAVDCVDFMPTVDDCTTYAAQDMSWYTSTCDFLYNNTPQSLFDSLLAANEAGTLNDSWKHFVLNVELVSAGTKTEFSYPVLVDETTTTTTTDETTTSTTDETTTSTTDGTTTSTTDGTTTVEGYLSGTCQEKCMRSKCTALSNVSTDVCNMNVLLTKLSPEYLFNVIDTSFANDAASVPDVWKLFKMDISIDISITKLQLQLIPETFIHGCQMPKMSHATINFLHIVFVFPFIYYTGSLLQTTHPNVAKFAMVIAILGSLYHFSRYVSS